MEDYHTMVKLCRSNAAWTGVGPVVLVAIMLQTACSLDRQIIHDRGGLQVGLQHDPTTDVIGLGEIGSGPASPRNDHPHVFTPAELRQLLGSLFVTVLEENVPRNRPLEAPLYRPDELNRLVPWLASAFSRAGNTDRVFFSLSGTPFSSTGGRTTGTLFVRHRTLHVAINPFVLPVEGDTTSIVGRSMTIRAAEPAHEVVVDGVGAQLWYKSETMHISLSIPDTISPELKVSQSVEARGTADQAGRADGSSAPANTEMVGDNRSKTLQRQVEDFAASLKEVQARLAEQAGELESVKAELRHLQDRIAKQRVTTITGGAKLR